MEKTSRWKISWQLIMNPVLIPSGLGDFSLSKAHTAHPISIYEKGEARVTNAGFLCYYVRCQLHTSVMGCFQ